MTEGKSISLNSLSPARGARRRKRRVGCGLGCGRGKTSGRGTKGQRSRSGGKGGLFGFEGGQSPLYMKMPKRGFTNGPFKTTYQVVHLKDLARVFKNQGEVNLEALRVHGLIKGRLPVKVLGDGELDKPLKVHAHAFSKSAQEKIVKAGGSAELLGKKKAGD